MKSSARHGLQADCNMGTDITEEVHCCGTLLWSPLNDIEDEDYPKERYQFQGLGSPCMSSTKSDHTQPGGLIPRVNCKYPEGPEQESSSSSQECNAKQDHC